MTDQTILRSQMLNETFGAFFRKKQERKPPMKSPEDVHDEHSDQVMHHLKQIHKLTHGNSEWHRALKKMGGHSGHVRDLHKHVGEMIDKFGE